MKRNGSEPMGIPITWQEFLTLTEHWLKVKLIANSRYVMSNVILHLAYPAFQ